MRKISVWAKTHSRTARVCIVLIKLLLILMAWFVGSTLFETGITLPAQLIFYTLFIFISAALLYPSKKGRPSSPKYFYIKQKTCDFFLAACSFVMITCIVNNPSYHNVTPPVFASMNLTVKPPTAEEIIASLKHRDKKSLTKQEKRILRKEFKIQLKKYAEAKLSGNKRDSDQTALIILVIIGAVGLTYLLLGLVCSIACGGADGLAVAVGILGLAGIIWLTVVLIRRIKRGPNKGKNWSKEN